MCMGGLSCALCACIGQEKVLDLLGLDDWVAMWILGIQLGFPERTTSALNH